jgi:superfamily II DNA helicase RecQ
MNFCSICRQDYGKLGVLKSSFPQVPILALTATATTEVRLDVMDILKLRPETTRFFTQDFNRPNLIFCVRPKARNKVGACTQILRYIKNETEPGSSGIVYCFSREDTENMADFLTTNGVSADSYHALMDTKQKLLVQEAWQRGDIHVVCATVAFGMGIDRTVRWVVNVSRVRKRRERFATSPLSHFLRTS